MPASLGRWLALRNCITGVGGGEAGVGGLTPRCSAPLLDRRRRWGLGNLPSRSMIDLRSHPTFSRLLPDTEEGASSAVVVRGSSQRVTTGDAQTVTAKGALAVVRVLLPGPRATVSTPPSKAPSTHDNNAVMLEWTMVLEHSSSSSAEAVWRTEKVGLGN